MKNIEKYEKELRKYGTGFALTKEGKLVNCVGFCCRNCAFNFGCAINKIKWLLQEYKDPIPPLITRYNEAYGQTLIVLSYENEDVCLPLFNRDKMFTNLEYEKHYTLEELGL